MSARGPVIGIDSNGFAASQTIFNTGTIHGLVIGADGIVIQSGGNRIVNSGEIIGSGDDGIQINANFQPGLHPNEIFNSGLISAPSFDFAIQTDDDADTITNTGLIEGRVFLGAGNDVFNGLGGRVTGEVQGDTSRRHPSRTESSAKVARTFAVRPGSWLTSMPRSCSRSSTLPSESGKRT